MNTKVFEKIDKDGISIITQKEKNQLIEFMNKQNDEITKQKFINETLEDISRKNLKTILSVSTRYNDILLKSLNEADKRFEQAKENYVHDKIHISKLSEAQGYYQALVDFKRKVGKDYDREN